MKRIFITLGILIFIYGCRQAENSKINVGVILPLTGNAAIYGKDLKNGIDLAYEKSKLKDRINLIYEDDAGDSKTGVNAVNNLIQKKVQFVIGGIMSSVANAILPITNSKQILLLSPKATSISLSKPDDYFFRIWPSDAYDGNIMSKFVFDSLKLRKVAVLYVNLDYGVGIKTIFENKFKELGGTIVYSEGYDSNRNDFRTTLLKIKESNPEALFLPAYFKDAVIILKQLNELKCNLVIIGTSGFYEQEVKNAAANLAEECYFTYPLFSPESEKVIVMNFVKDFNLKYGELPNAFSAHGYDSYRALESSIDYLLENKLPVNSEGIKNFFENVKTIEGVTGNYSFDKNGDVIKELHVLKLSNQFK